ncbi:MAG TPA: helix-turn-helix transcriptional regulator [Terriglobia bacterium]|nr:helix-turn-helix transcriptional regulator [Terriglobia bacterium]
MKAAADLVPVLFRHYVPAKPLSEFVGLFWYWQGHDVPYSKERVLPMGTVELVIQLGSHKTSDSGISGARSESLVIERTSQDQLLGIHFKPGGAFPFLGFPFGDLHNIGITLGDLWGETRARHLLCLLHEARTIEMKFQVLENWLLRIADRPLKHHPAVSFAIREFQNNPGLLTSADVAETVGFSQRRFIELFRNEVGLTPKLFCRVQRFQEVLGMIHKRDTVDWLDIALSRGYSDQSHFIHDFREFSGLSPTEYLGLRTENLGHVQFRD